MLWRKGRDSDPRGIVPLRFSRPAPSAARPPFHFPQNEALRGGSGSIDLVGEAVGALIAGFPRSPEAAPRRLRSLFLAELAIRPFRFPASDVTFLRLVVISSAA